jgi:hypothetical protein
MAAEELGGRLVSFFVLLTEETEHGGEGLESLILADFHSRRPVGEIL